MTTPSVPRILVVEALSGGALLINTALELGMNVVVASADVTYRKVPKDLRGKLDELITVETNNTAELVSRVRELHRRRPLDAVFPGCDVYIPAAAAIAAELGLSGLDVRTVDRVRDKARMREAVATAGLRTARSAEVASAVELPEAAAHTGFPCVLKPVDQSGSLHVTNSTYLAELTLAYDKLISDDLYDLGRPMDCRALVQEYLNGHEYSIEGYVLGDRTHVVAIVEKLLGPEPCFAELGHTVPAQLPGELEEQVKAYTEGVTRAVGVSVGPFHCELRITDKGPVLVEIGARLAGDRITELVELARGVSLARIWLAAHLRIAPESIGAFSPPVAPYSAIHFFTGPGESRFERVTGLKEILELEGVREAKVEAVPGDPIHPLNDLRCRLGHAIFTADSCEAVPHLRLKVGETIRVNPKDDSGD